MSGKKVLVIKASRIDAEAFNNIASRGFDDIHSNSTSYGNSFFQQFDLVLNALDHHLDRDQKNAMCVKAIDCYAEMGNLTEFNHEYKVWSQQECQSIFATNLNELRKELSGQDQTGVIERAIVDLVTASTNLGATILDVPRKSRLEIRYNIVLVLDEPGLSDMPNEVLEQIFDHFDDENLLAVSRTCKRFQSVVNRAFDRKYSNQPYKIAIFRDYLKVHRAILINFGANFTNFEIIDADLTNTNRWLFDMLKENGTTVKRLKLSSEYDDIEIKLSEILRAFPNLTHLNLNGFMTEEDNDWSSMHMPYLKHLGMVTMYFLNKDRFDRFFSNNRQIESLFLQEDTEIDGIDFVITIDEIQFVERQLPNLKSFSVKTKLHTNLDEHQLVLDEILSMISNTKVLTQLEVIEIDVKFLKHFVAEFHARFLEAIGANRPDFKLLLEVVGRRGWINLVVTKNQIISSPIIVNQFGWEPSKPIAN